MSSHQATASLRIASSGTTSNALSDFWGTNPAKVALDHAASVTIQPPAALTGTVKVEVTLDGSTWATLVSAGADVSVAAGKAVVIPRFTARDLRLKSSGAEAADRDFFVTIQEEIGF